MILAFVSPIYLTIVNAFKTEDAIVERPGGAARCHPTLGNLIDRAAPARPPACSSACATR